MSKTRQVCLALLGSAAALTGSCTLLNRDVVLAGSVLEMQDDTALVSVHTVANARPGQQLIIYRVDLVPAVKPTAPPWRRLERTGSAVLIEVLAQHAVRVRVTDGSIARDREVELQGLP